jgi:hypothetical protein
MSQSVPIARIRLIKVDVGPRPVMHVPGSRLPAESPEQMTEPRQGADPRVYLSAPGS